MKTTQVSQAIIASIVAAFTLEQSAISKAKDKALKAYRESWFAARDSGVTPADFKAAMVEVVTKAGYSNAAIWTQATLRRVDPAAFAIRKTSGESKAVKTKVIRLTDDKKKAFVKMAVSLKLTSQQIEALLLTLVGDKK